MQMTDGWTDGDDMMKLAGTFRNCANMPYSVLNQHETST